MNWLERARREIREAVQRPTAVTAERTPTAVMAVPNPSVGAKSDGPVDRQAAQAASDDLSFEAYQNATVAPAKPATEPPVSPESDPAVEARRQRVLTILERHPGLTYAVVTDSRSEPGVVVVHIAIRGIGTGELLVARERYDGAELMRAMDRAASGQGC